MRHGMRACVSRSYGGAMQMNVDLTEVTQMLRQVRGSDSEVRVRQGVLAAAE